MKRTLLACLATAILTAAATYFSVRLHAIQPAEVTLRLENSRLRVSEIVYQPGVPRTRHTRPTDQVIIFLDDCRYERADPVTGSKSIRVRKSGDVIWHSKGEEAPVLVNAGPSPYRTMLVELK